MNHFQIVPSFVNTREFSCEAKNFIKNGYYTNSPPGTYAYREYWDEQTKRCMDGFSLGGVRITGAHYFYLNFTQIKATVKQGKIERKILTFPSFLDMDYYYFMECELARQNGQGVIVAKARRKGFSYKNGALCVYQYNFFRDSTSIIGAYLQAYSGATMSMAFEMLNFINKYTAWGKRRNPDRRDFVKARFKEVVDGKEVWNGYNSEIFTLTFKDNFSAAIGKTADLMLFEEAGKFPNLINAYMVTAPVFRDGNVMIGMPLIFGTGGDMDGGSNDFAEMFYNPEKYWLRPYENIYDEGGAGTNCGFFIDDMWYKPGKVTLPDTGEVVKMVDEEGNSNRKAAEAFLDQERGIIKTTDSRSTWEKYITQSPKTPREAFLKTSGNIFPTIELNAWLAEIEVTKKAQDLAMIGEFYWEKDKVKWTPNIELKPIIKFPLKPNEDKTGCVVIWEHPYRDGADETPFGLYIAGTDPYDQDTSTTNSLGSTFIYKTFQKFDKTYSLPVAEYTGRPETAKEYYETIRKLLTYYNAQTLYENNLKGLKIYFEQKKCLHLLKAQPGILKDIVNRSTVARGYGVHMSEPIKVQAEIYLRDWLLEKRADTDEGDQLNLHSILSIPLLKELIAYDKNGNFDRAIAFMLCILHSHENYQIDLEAQFDYGVGDKFWRTSHFKKRKMSF
tara:strand:- start:30891 stop:32906 length:2016 start_codon:yes stop_codon:yes gene_type:complete